MRRVFYSFYYKQDSWRAAKVRNIGVVDGNRPARDNDWETVKRGGDAAIRRWIDNQLHGRSCTIVLAGGNTAGRKWIDYEIKKSWHEGKGIAGIYIHGLTDMKGNTSSKGGNPFGDLFLGGKRLSSIVPCYLPAGRSSKQKYQWIADNLDQIVEEAIAIRNDYRR